MRHIPCIRWARTGRVKRSWMCAALLGSFSALLAPGHAVRWSSQTPQSGGRFAPGWHPPLPTIRPWFVHASPGAPETVDDRRHFQITREHTRHRRCPGTSPGCRVSTPVLSRWRAWPVVNFVAAQESPLPGHLALACRFIGHQNGRQIEQAQTRAITALDVVWVMNFTPQQLQSAANTEHWHATLHRSADFGSESALAQVTQAGDRVFTPGSRMAW